MPYNDQTRFDLLAIVSDMFGEEAANRVVAECGGTVVHIPERSHLNEAMPLVVALGIERTRLLGQQLGGVQFYVRVANRAALALKLIEEAALPVRAIAKASGLTERQVYRIKADRRRQARADRRASSPAAQEIQA